MGEEQKPKIGFRALAAGEQPCAVSAGSFSRILLVDNDERRAKMIDIRLRAAGCEVTCVSTSQEASEVVFRLRPSLILLQIDQAFYSGLEFHELLKSTARGRSIPVVYLSGEHSWARTCASRRLKPAAVLPPPREVDEVTSVVERILHEAHQPSMRRATSA